MFTCVKNIILCFVLMGVTACQASEVITIKTPSGEQVVFLVSTAVSSEEQQRGLMFVETMPDNEGMIFLYDHEQVTKFWMKNTLIPLDMLFFDKNGMLTYIEQNAQPHNLLPKGPNTLICSVLEINGGLAKSINITVGSKILTNLTQECLQSSIKQ